MDPMCGSGTIAIEAALWSANFAPGLLRDTFGFEHWTGFSEEDRAELKVLKGELRGAVKSTTARVIDWVEFLNLHVEVYQNQTGFL